MGVWIETLDDGSKSWLQRVTPFVGVWIETRTPLGYQQGQDSHTLRGCVD